jgi:hypothetical protein
LQTNRVENVPETTVKPSKTKKSIIDELTGEKQPDGSTSKPTGNPQEDGGHA